MDVQIEELKVEELKAEEITVYNYRAPMTLGRKLRSEDLLDYLGANRKKTVIKVLGVILAVVFFVTVAFYLVSDLTAYIKDKNADGSSVIVESVISIVTLLGTLYMCKEISQNDDSEKTHLTYSLCEENQSKRKLENIAKEQLSALGKYVDDVNSGKYHLHDGKADLRTEYYSKNYSELREYAYHLENIGNILLEKKVNFELLFNIVSFPDWMMEESKELRALARTRYIPDFWIGTEFLYKSYQVKRSYNNYMLRRPSIGNMAEYNSLKNKRAKKKYLKKELSNAKKEWKNYSRNIIV